MKKLLRKFCLCFISIFLGAQIVTFVPAFADASITESAFGKSYYVATDGSDNNPGTLEKPFASLMKAQESADPGDTVFIRGGIYKISSIANTAAVGSVTYHYVNEFNKSKITYRGYGSEIPIFNFSNIPTDGRVAAFYITPDAHDITFEQFEVIGIKVGNQKQSEGFRIEGKNINLNRVNVHDNQAVGIYYVTHGTGTVYRCDSYNNIGVNQSIGNCDGFGAHGDGTTFKECRAWNNSDDGYDCINVHGAVVFDSCWAFDMNAGGDSNGFKVGGFARSPQTVAPPVHIVTNSISAGNRAHGFYANHQPGQSAIWTNNTAYNNKLGNFDMLECATLTDGTDIPGTREVLHYNVAYKNNKLDDANLPTENNRNNSWNLAGMDMVDADFQSLDMSELSKPRGEDGALPDITFMRPTDSYKFKGLGHIY